MSDPWPSGGADQVRQTPESELDPAAMDRAVRVVTEAADQASQITRAMPVGQVSTKKNPADLVTEVDTAVERAVRAVIMAAFPDHAIVGEEYGGAAAGPTWYCDPVDGTTNLAAGIPWTSFSLCLVVGRHPLVGVITDPWRHQTWLARRGGGVLVNGHRPETGPGSDWAAAGPQTSSAAGRPAPSPFAGTVVGTEWAGHRPWPGMEQFLDSLAQRHGTSRIAGSSTLTLAQPAMGQTIGAVIHHFQPEDHLAAALIAQEAGLAVWDDAGQQQPFPSRGGIMVTRPELAEELYGMWAPER